MSWFKKKKYVLIGEKTDTEERIAKIERLVDFLCHHDRNDVVPEVHIFGYSYSLDIVTLKATYIANNEVKTVVIGNFSRNEADEAVVIHGKIPVVRIGKRSFAIDKPTGTAIEVTDLDICKGNLS